MATRIACRAPHDFAKRRRSGCRRPTGTGSSKRNHLAPLYVNEGLFPPVDDAPVLAVVKQTALDDRCGPAL